MKYVKMQLHIRVNISKLFPLVPPSIYSLFSVSFTYNYT